MQGRRGRFPVGAVALLVVALELHRIGMHARAAAVAAEELLSGGAAGSEIVKLSIDRKALDALVQDKLREVAERVVVPRRGRPQRGRPLTQF